MTYDREYYLRNRERWKEYSSRPKVRERHREIANRSNARAKAEILRAYGSKCVCCGETREAFLTVDHANGDGKQHRSKVGGSGFPIYRAIKKEGYSPDKYRILCMNCNWATRYGKPCPHKLGPTRLEAN